MRSISCPWCGTHSSLTTELPMEPRAWTQDCPACKRPWNLKVWIKRGMPELMVEPGTPATKSARKPTAKKKPAVKKSSAMKAPPAKKAVTKKPAAKRAAAPAKKSAAKKKSKR